MAIPKWLFSRTRSLCYGLSLPYKALRVILEHPRLMVLSLIPISLTLVLYVYVIQRVQHWAQSQFMALFQAYGWNPEGFWAFIALLAFKILIFLASVLTFSLAASVIASPFNDFLAEGAERWTQPPLPPVPVQSWSLKVRLIWIDIAKTVAATLASVTALLISWLPGLNFVAMILAFLLICFQYTSYAQTRRNLTVAEGLAFLWRHVFACAGFGASLSVLFAIPLLSSFCVPLAVVGGTLLVARAQGIPDDFPLK